MIITVAYFLNGLGLGGTEKTAYLFAKYLDTSKYKVTFITYNDADLSRLAEINKKFEVVLFDRKNPNFALLEQYDIVHVFQSGGPERPRPGVDYTKKDNAKFIVHNVFGMYDPNPQIDVDIFMSQWLLDRVPHRRLNNNRLLAAINNPVEHHVNTNIFKLNLPEDTTIVGHISRPDPGLFDGLSTDACAALLKKGCRIHYLAMSPPENLVQALSKHNIPHTIIDPNIDHSILCSFYNTIDILLWDRCDGESGGSCLQEAQMAGKPIIVCPAIPKYLGMTVWQNQLVIVQDGKTGFCAKRDITDYADKIEILINNPELRWNMGFEASMNAKNNFHVSVTVPKLEKIYESLFINPFADVPYTC